MIGKKIYCLGLALAISFFLFGCGGDGGSGSSGTGTVTMDITDSKPLLPVDVDQVILKFSGVSVHKSGGGWLALPLAEELQMPYEIDLLQFTDGTATEFVPPTPLEEGHYTQVRIEVIEAEMIPIVDGEPGEPIPLVISSDQVKTDHQFDFQVKGGGAVDVMIDFDLSGSIVATGDGTYKLKPVLHLNETQEAATIQSEIDNASFGESGQATVIVTLDGNEYEALDVEDEVYTRIVVEEDTSSDTTEFKIFWLVPNHGYFVHIDLEGNAESTEDESVFEYDEFVPASKLPAGAIFWLNDPDPDDEEKGDPIAG